MALKLQHRGTRAPEAKTHELQGLAEALEAVHELEQEAAPPGQEGPAEREPGDGSEDSYGPCATGMTDQEKAPGAPSVCGPYEVGSRAAHGY